MKAYGLPRYNEYAYGYMDKAACVAIGVKSCCMKMHSVTRQRARRIFKKAYRVRCKRELNREVT